MVFQDTEQNVLMPEELHDYEYAMLPDWKRIRLGDICSLRSETINPVENPDNKYVGLEHIDSGDPHLSRWGWASEVQSAKSRFSKNDILYGKLRPYLDKAVLAKVDGICSTDILVFSVHPAADSNFLSYLLHTKDFINFALLTTKGVNHPRTSWSSLAQFEFAFPPLPEQRAIAHILQTVQNAIQARRKELQLERERKAALMQHLFTHGTRGEATKQTEIGEMPERWDVVQLGDLCENDLGFIQTGPFGSQLHASDYRDYGVPVVNPTHLGINTIVEDHLPLISQENADGLAKHYLAEGDILISRRGDFSRYSYITEKQVGWLCGTGCLLIRLSNPKVDNRFLSISIGSENIQQYFAQNATGLIMPNLNTKILERLTLALPSIDEQKEIAHTIDACDSKIAALEKEITLQEELFRALLEELMTGRLSTLPLIE